MKQRHVVFISRPHTLTTIHSQYSTHAHKETRREREREDFCPFIPATDGRTDEREKVFVQQTAALAHDKLQNDKNAPRVPSFQLQLLLLDVQK